MLELLAASVWILGRTWSAKLAKLAKLANTQLLDILFSLTACLIILPLELFCAYGFMVKQKLRIILLTLLAALVFLPAKLSAEYTFKPKVGLWFGPTTPLFSTSTTVDGYLGGGIFARTNLPHNDFFFNLDGSWLHFSSRVDNRLDLYPIVGSVLYRLPLQLPVQILLKGGAGASYVKIRPEYRVGWDPQLLFGSEFYFPAGKIVRIGLRVDFLWTVEQHIKSEERYLYDGNGYKTVSDGQRGGYTMYIGLMAFFNLVK